VTSETNDILRVVDLTVAGFLDSATGRASRRDKGDYAAIVTCGLDRAGHLYVLDVWLKRASPTRQIAAMFDLHEKWNYALFGLETNCFQQLLLLPIEEERERRKKANRPWQLAIREVHHSQNKEMRIATLEPLVANGWLRFAHDLPEPFWAQMQSFPNADHDDALDALEGAASLLRSMQMETRGGKRRGSVRKLAAF